MQSIWESPDASDFHQKLAESARVILFDKRGTGMSDRVKALPGLAQRMEDLEIVLDAVGSERAFVLGMSEGAPMSILYAASHPERVRGLALIGGFARMREAEDHPCGWPAENIDRLDAYIRERWGEGSSLLAATPSHAALPAVRDWAARAEQIGGSPGAALELWSMNREIDVREVLPVLQVPCLVIHANHDPVIDVGQGRLLASAIEDAEYLEIDSGDHVPFYPPDQGIAVDAIQDWLETATDRTAIARVLATLLVCDLDLEECKSEVLEGLEQLVVAHRGRLIQGDQISCGAIFDGPALAIRCGLALRDSHLVGGATLRSGLHCSEVAYREIDLGEGRAQARLGLEPGSGVEIAAQLCAHATQGEVLVTRTLRELVIGSGLSFEERGEIAFDGAETPRPYMAAARA